MKKLKLINDRPGSSNTPNSNRIRKTPLIISNEKPPRHGKQLQQMRYSLHNKLT